ncbi:MAG TPA: flagellar hook basal-body protein, partial [Clostridia bacterium]|nr:flagellar hook basal-body protein [Clostridia bacterium]
MIRAFFSGASGLAAQQTRVDTCASNIANSQTNGYKSSRTEFSELKYAPIAGNGSVGQGVRAASNTKVFTPGILIRTDRALDIAVDGDGFLKVASGGDVFYTRGGSFQISVENGNQYVVTAEGYYLLDKSNMPLTVNGDDYV